MYTQDIPTRQLTYSSHTQRATLWEDILSIKEVNPYEYILPQYIELLIRTQQEIITHDLDGEPILLVWIPF